MPVNPTTGQELQNAKQTDNFLNLDESLRKNRHTFTPESLQYCSRKHCTLVPKFTALHFPEITVFLFPVYRVSFAGMAVFFPVPSGGQLSGMGGQFGPE